MWKQPPLTAGFELIKNGVHHLTQVSRLGTTAIWQNDERLKNRPLFIRQIRLVTFLQIC
jgi:hypothetical protein